MLHRNKMLISVLQIQLAAYYHNIITYHGKGNKQQRCTKLLISCSNEPLFTLWQLTMSWSGNEVQSGRFSLPITLSATFNSEAHVIPLTSEHCCDEGWWRLPFTVQSLNMWRHKNGTIASSHSWLGRRSGNAVISVCAFDSMASWLPLAGMYMWQWLSQTTWQPIIHCSRDMTPPLYSCNAR